MLIQAIETGNQLYLCFHSVEFSDLNLTLLPSLGEICEIHEILNGVWQCVKHESMNSPQSLLCSATFNSLTNFFLNPAAWRMESKASKKQHDYQISIKSKEIRKLHWVADHAVHPFVWNYNSEYLLCNWTMPVQDRIHSEQERFVSEEKQQSGVFTFWQVEKNLKIEITCQES
jgi:hypothetical protein